MTDKITDLEDARMEEIRKDAEKEYEKYKHKGENEPENLVSGDMNKAINGDDDN